jgi:hypothetical protein
MSPSDAPRTKVETLNPGEGELLVPGELIYEYAPQVIQIVEYGASAEALLSGQERPAAEGARIDFYLEGPVIGPKLRGMLKGVDYLYFRADGRVHLHIHAEITTDDGKKIALAAEGIAISRQGSSVLDLRENVTLLTNYPEFSWVNAIQIWASGTVDVSSGHVHVKAYAV